MFKITVISKRNAKSILRNARNDAGKVTLPSSITKIEANAFEGIDFESFGIDTLVIGNSVESVGEYAFRNARLKNIVFKTAMISLIIKKLAFYESRINNVVIGRIVREIPDRCFEESTVESVDIEQTECQYIGQEAFSRCKYLKQIKLSKYIYKIGNRAFADTRSLEEIEFSLPEIPFGLFKKSNIKRIILHDVLRVECDAFEDCNELTSIIFTHDNVAKLEIENFAFCRCRNLKTISTQTPITKIGDYAFSDCDKLESIDLSNVLEIGKHAFGRASSIRVINLISIDKLGENAFEGCIRLRSAKISGELVEIPSGLFCNCENLENIEFSSEVNNVEKINSKAFENCKRLKRISAMPSLVEIGSGAFSECRALEEIFFSKYLQKIGEQAFINCTSLTEVICTAPLYEIGDCAFFECANLENVEINNPIKMGRDVFTKCWHLENIKFLNNSKGEE